jgi:hypothetical protein
VGGGVYIYDHTSNSSPDQPQSASSATASSKPKSTVDVNGAKQVVTSLYTDYLNNNQGEGSPLVADKDKQIVAQYGDSNLVNQYASANDMDLVFCGQMEPHSFQITGTTVSGGDVTVAVSQDYGDGSSVRSSAVVIGSRIDKIICPAIN